MFQAETTIKNPTGLHARPASQLTQLCKNFPEKITLLCGEHQVDPKSIISILAAGMKSGTAITVQVEGDNEQAVGEEIITFINGLTE